MNNFDINKTKLIPTPLAGLEGERLVFLIGVPRAGKSLIEKMLVETGHAIGLGEMGAFERIFKKITKNVKTKEYSPDDSLSLDRDLIQFMAHEYSAEVNRRSFADAKIVVDATPTNYQHIGLIANVFPKAKIIYCSRHPLDHCLQIYFKYFSEGNGFSYDLIKLAHFYVQYNKLMGFWKQNAILQMMDVSYEELIRHPSETIGKICDFVGISATHKRDDFHRHEIGLWKNYESYLEVVKAIFEKHQLLF